MLLVRQVTWKAWGSMEGLLTSMKERKENQAGKTGEESNYTCPVMMILGTATSVVELGDEVARGLWREEREWHVIGSECM